MVNRRETCIGETVCFVQSMVLPPSSVMLLVEYNERLPLPPNPMVGFSLPAGMFPSIIVFVLIRRPAIGATSCRSVNKDNATTLLETQALGKVESNHWIRVTQ